MCKICKFDISLWSAWIYSFKPYPAGNKRWYGTTGRLSVSMNITIHDLVASNEGVFCPIVSRWNDLAFYLHQRNVSGNGGGGGVNGLQIGQVGKIVFRADNITHFREHKSSLFLVYFVQYCFSIFFSNLKNLK